MSELRIGEVAKRTGLQPSAIRYYEDLKLIAPAGRSGGSRRYDESAVERLALIAFAKDAGFTLADIRRLISGFTDGTPASERWHVLAERKLADLDRAAERIEAMRAILKRAIRCGCMDLDECAKRISAAKSSRAAPRPAAR
jgi:MerR family transcriptional regulator, redox-sensitive transcriptional activator SoxR